jgi:hypothetical protein
MNYMRHTLQTDILYVNIPVWTDHGVGVATGLFTEQGAYEIRMFRMGEAFWLPIKELRTIEEELRNRARLSRLAVADEMLKLRRSIASGKFPSDFPDTSDWDMPVLQTPWPKGLGDVRNTGVIMRPTDLSDTLRLIIDEQSEAGTLFIALQWKEKDHEAMVERMEKFWFIPKLPADFRWMDSLEPDEGGPSGYVYLQLTPGVKDAILANGFTGIEKLHKTMPSVFRIGSIRLALALIQMGYPLNKYASKNRPSRISKARAAAASDAMQPGMDIF